jgi:hypothetical protein
MAREDERWQTSYLLMKEDEQWSLYMGNGEDEEKVFFFGVVLNVRDRSSNGKHREDESGSFWETKRV